MEFTHLPMRLQHRHRLPRALRLLPINTFEQHRELGLRQMDFATLCERPDEASSLKPFGQKTKAIARRPQEFNDVAAPASEDKNVTGEWVILKRCLDLCSQPLEAITHISHTRSDPNPSARRKADHRAVSGRRDNSRINRRSTFGDTSPRTRRTACSKSTSHTPDSARVFSLPMGVWLASWPARPRQLKQAKAQAADSQ